MARPSVEAQRREQILRAACEVIADKGITSLRVTDVARRAQISTGSVHYYFATKHDLIHAAFEWNFTRSLARRESVLARYENPLERLRAIVTSYLRRDAETTAAWHVWAQTWVEALHDGDLRELNERVYGQWRSMITQIVRDGQDRNVIVEGDPVLLADVLISTIDGLAIQSLVGPGYMTQARVRAVCAHLVASLSTAADTDRPGHEGTSGQERATNLRGLDVINLGGQNT